MRKHWLASILAVFMIGIMAPAASADVIVYVGYLNNISGPPAPAVIPTPFDPDASTILISSGGVATVHGTGVLRFENVGAAPATINPGVNVNTQFGSFQIWDGFLPIVLGPGMNLVLAETANFNFQTYAFGFGMDPIVGGFVNGVRFEFTDTARVLLAHEGADYTAQTTPYGVLGTIPTAAPEPATIALFGGGLAALLLRARRFTSSRSSPIGSRRP